VIRAAILTVSDGAAAGEREDASGPALASALRDALGADVDERAVVADDRAAIAGKLRGWSAAGFDLVLSTGGTGVSPRDRTPEAFRDVIDFEIPGIAEKMRAATGAGLPAAYLSRQVAGVAGSTLCIALPGSPSGAVECFRSVAELLPHAIALARGERPAHPRPQPRGAG
jgi:molybdenum cofactor synthesis domain-containing protein